MVAPPIDALADIQPSSRESSPMDSSVLAPISTSVLRTSNAALDDSLVARYLAGDPQAFEALYERHAARLQIYISGLTNHWQEAEEITQDVFIGLARTLIHYQARGTFISYLLVCARNKTFERKASQAARRRREGSVAAQRSWFTVNDSADAAQQAEWGEKVTAALRNLPEEQREVVVLRIYQELTFQEIADLTQTPIGTVSSRFNYALEKLRAILGDWGK